MIQTHYICPRCGKSFNVIVDRSKKYTCEKCGQEYGLVSTWYGDMMIIIGGKEKKDESEQLDMF